MEQKRHTKKRKSLAHQSDPISHYWTIHFIIISLLPQLFYNPISHDLLLHTRTVHKFWIQGYMCIYG